MAFPANDAPELFLAQAPLLLATFDSVAFDYLARQKVHGRYRSRDLCLAYINTLIAGQPDAVAAGVGCCSRPRTA